MQPNIKHLDDADIRGIEDPKPANDDARYAMVSDDEGDYVEEEEGVYVNRRNPKDRLHASTTSAVLRWVPGTAFCLPSPC